MKDALNARDHDGIVHNVLYQDRPSNLKLGRTACGRIFTWPLYSHIEAETRWDGTHDDATCLTCIVCPESNP